MRSQKPVSRERAGHVERPCGPVREGPRERHIEGPWDHRVPGEAGVQRVDHRRSSGPEVSEIQGEKKLKISPEISQK